MMNEPTEQIEMNWQVEPDPQTGGRNHYVLNPDGTLRWACRLSGARKNPFWEVRYYGASGFPDCAKVPGRYEDLDQAKAIAQLIETCKL